MDRVRDQDSASGLDDYDVGYGLDGDSESHDGPPPMAIGNDERRMHVRAYNYWTSLLGERSFPSIKDLNPGEIEDFGPHSVLLDFTGGLEDPAVAWLGTTLRQECEIEGPIGHISEVPNRSLLSRLTDHYLQIIANSAPIGFEAEFTNARGSEILYRGILMPFSSDGETIDFIYGVINWKEVAGRDVLAGLNEEVSEALRTAPALAPAPAIPVWADGPTRGEPEELELTGYEDDDLLDLDGLQEVDSLLELDGLQEIDGLGGLLEMARGGAADAVASDARSHAALYRAIGLAHDFAIAAAAEEDEYLTLLDDAGIKVQARSPMTAIAKLVFGVAHDKTRLTEYAAALEYAWNRNMPAGSLAAFLEDYDGGLKGLIRSIRAERNNARPPRPDPVAAARVRLATAPALDAIDFDDDGLAVVVARRDADGGYVIVGQVGGGKLRDGVIAHS